MLAVLRSVMQCFTTGYQRQDRLKLTKAPEPHVMKGHACKILQHQDCNAFSDKSGLLTATVSSIVTALAGEAYTKAGGKTGTGSAPCTSLRLVPTRVWKARLKALLPTLGLPKVMQRMSAWGYCRAAHVAPACKS